MTKRLLVAVLLLTDITHAWLVDSVNDCATLQRFERKADSLAMAPPRPFSSSSSLLMVPRSTTLTVTPRTAGDTTTTKRKAMQTTSKSRIPASPRTGWTKKTESSQRKQSASVHQPSLSTSTMVQNVPLLAKTNKTANSGRSGGSSALFSPGTPVVVEVTNFGPLGASVDVLAIGHYRHPDDDEEYTHHDNDESELNVWSKLLSPSSAPLAKGLILQKEIHLFRQSRDNVDICRGEVLNAYVERIRSRINPSPGVLGTSRSTGTTTTGSTPETLPKLDICLRTFGSMAKAQEASVRIWNCLQQQVQQQQHQTNNYLTVTGRTTATTDGIGGMVLPIGYRSSHIDIQRYFPGMSKVTFRKAIRILFDEGKIVVPTDCSIHLKQEISIDCQQQHRQSSWDRNSLCP